MSAAEAARLEEADKAVAEVIDVDDFSPEELTQHRAVEGPRRTTAEEAGAQTRGSNPEPPASRGKAAAAPERQPEPAE